MKLGLELGLDIYKPSGTTSRLLDEYSGAAAAYSLRYLTNSYTGDVVLVRRSSDDAELGFTPTEITDGTLTAFCGAGDGFVKTWYDQSGNNNNVIAPTDGEQPVLVNAGALITQGTKPAIQFTPSHNLSLTISIIPSQIFLTTNTTTGEILKLSGGEVIEGLGAYQVFTAVGDDLTSTIPLPAHAVVTFDNLNIELYVNNTLEDSGSTFRQVFNRIVFGANDLDGNIQEAIYYPAATDQSANRAVIETNINNYYSIY